MIEETESAKVRWRRQAAAVLGLWLFVAPWYLPHAMATVTALDGAGNFAVWNFRITGTLVFFVVFAALVQFRVWKERENAAPRTRLSRSLCLFGIGCPAASTWNAAGRGLIVIAPAGGCIGDAHDIVPKRTGSRNDL